MLTYYMLIGVPGSGKSFWAATQPFDWSRMILLSTDNIIEMRAKALGKTYTEVFAKEIKSATAEMNQQWQMAMEQNFNIIHDQTNLTEIARADKLAKIPATYSRVAVFFPTPPDQELERRLASRPGKTIPAKVVQSMKDRLQPPRESEGFHRIITV